MNQEFYTQLMDDVENGKIKNIVCNVEGVLITMRLFLSGADKLCFFKKRSSTKGFILPMTYDVVKVNYVNECETDQDMATFKLVNKFYKKAQKATFENSFITKCLQVPSTYEKWIEEGKKGCYDYGLTTGTLIDGKIIKINTIEKLYGFRDISLRISKFLKDQKPFTTCTYIYRGYDASITGYIDGSGRPMVMLNMEYIGCANGHYYMLINDNEFIGVDID